MFKCLIIQLRYCLEQKKTANGCCCSTRLWSVCLKLSGHTNLLKQLYSFLNFSSVIITFYRQRKQNTVSLLLTRLTFHSFDLNFFDWYWLIGPSAGACRWQVSSKPGCVSRPCGVFCLDCSVYVGLLYYSRTQPET